MSCLICGKPTKKPINKFCSVECKSASQSGKRLNQLNPTINIRCKLDGKEFKDYLNSSGALTQYSKNTLNKIFDWNDWEQFAVELTPTWNCPHCDWKTVDLENKSGCITTHLEEAHNTNPEQHCAQFPEDVKLWKMFWQRQERINEINESEDNRVQCQICKEWLKRISSSHLKLHNTNENEYRTQFGHDSLSSVAFRKQMSVNYYQNEKLLESAGNWRSKYEDELCELFKSLDIEYIPNHKKFGFDLDILLPNNSIAIEFNGLYWHSQWAGGKLEHYHRNKTIECEKVGIHLIHIFEDEWVNNKDIVISRLKNLLQKSKQVIYARKCEIKEINYQDAAKFLVSNHLQGTVTTSNVHIGLYHENELVSLMTFGKPRSSTGNKDRADGYWELMRFCNKCDTNVVGGASKLFSYFEKTYQPVNVHSFADRRWTSTLKDSLYDELGFMLISLGAPNYWYLVEPMKRTSRFSYTKQTILDKFKDADPNLSEWENMVNLGFDRIWDCGSLKYEKKYDQDTIKPTLTESVVSKESQKTKKRQRVKKAISRNIQDTECKICGNSYSMAGIANHFKREHELSVLEYVSIHGEYRPLELTKLRMLEKSAGKFKCRICDDVCRNERHLTDHIERQHDYKKEQYVIEFILNGVIPTCKCGCGEFVSVLNSYPYVREYLSGHNESSMTGKTHSDVTKDKMKLKASGRFDLDWHITQYGEVDGTARYNERNKMLSEKRTGAGNPEFVDIPKDELISFITENPQCKLIDITNHFNVGSTCIYGKFKLYFDCKNLNDVKLKLN